MREAGENVEQDHFGQAFPQQVSARQGLDEMLDILTNRRQHELAGLVAKLREAERKLAGLRQATGRIAEENAAGR